MASRIRPLVGPQLLILLVAAYITAGGCDSLPVDLDDQTGMAQVIFRIAWPSHHLGRAAGIPLRTSDLAIRIAKSTDKLKEGTVAHVSRAETQVTMYVESGSDYGVEVLCLVETPNYSDSYSPVGYGISNGLTFLPDTTNHVTVNVDTLVLSLTRNDTLSAGDTLNIALTLTLNDHWSDFSKYIPEKIKIPVNDPDNLVSGNSITLDEISRDAIGATFEWQSEMKDDGTLELFIEGTESYQFKDLTDAFQTTVWPAWTPPDFGEAGDRFTILVTEGTSIVVTIPR